MKSLVAVILLLILPMLARGAEPGLESSVVVVMSTSSTLEALTREQVVNIFFGRFRQLPNGMTARPVDQPTSRALKSLFYRRLVGKDLAEINAYWARLIFSGRTAPPHQTATPQEVLRWLTEQPGAVGYIWSEDLTPELRVVFDLSQ